MKRWQGLLVCVLVLVAMLWSQQPVLAVPRADTTYTVQPGDTLTRVAARYGLSVSQLAIANGLSRDAWIYAGQQLVIPDHAAIEAVPVPSGSTYVVQRGDTLMSIAMRYGVTVRELASLNGLYWNAWVYVGQPLTIPGQPSVAATPTLDPTVSAATLTPTPDHALPTPTPTPHSDSSSSTLDVTPSLTPDAVVSFGDEQVYVVEAGNTLFSIARGNGTTVEALRAANGLASNTIYVGQRLRIPEGIDTPDSTPNPAPTPTPPLSPGAEGEKWIDVNLSQQQVTAYEGETPVYSAVASTGLPGTPTVVGTFTIYVKYLTTPMSGPGYNLSNVPHTMYFYRGYAIHGAYWHNNFGTPMSHGCVNLSLPDAEWFYNWAPVGTKVISHY